MGHRCSKGPGARASRRRHQDRRVRASDAPSLAPVLEHHQRPEDMTVVGAVLEVLALETLHHRGLEEPFCRNPRGCKQMIHKWPERLFQPIFEGDAETLFASIDTLRGHMP